MSYTLQIPFGAIPVPIVHTYMLHARRSLHEHSCIRELCCMELLVTLCLKIEEKPGIAILL